MIRRAFGGVLVLGLVACSSSLQQQGRVTLTGRPYYLQHIPQRRGGDRITGLVCGVDVELTVTPQPDRIWVRGFLDGRNPVDLSVHVHEDGTRAITGSLGRSVRTSKVELQLGPEELTGQIGLRRFDLDAAGDIFQGEMTYITCPSSGRCIAPVQEFSTEAVIHGREQLGQMDPAEQAALLPLLLTCNGNNIEQRQTGRLVVGIGGKPGYEPRGSSSIYLF
jgi:hypothetical protein